ncbi:unnamed protein product [Brachionus calyciflorus]|uniref:tRNA-intron lyase n=1 Tax=Brachionus calyciflorus TaxID=104777 RepID=A0A814PCS2_9BILA|nr:unnamed protein product [Brachionus calyciflorus]
MFPFSLHSIKEPRSKKSATKESIFLPLPIPILVPNDKNLEEVSKTLPGQYTAILKDNRIYVENEWEAKILFNCGYFGKGEFSRGGPCLNNDTKPKKTDEEVNELSINYKNLIPISQEKFNHKKNWLENFDSTQKDSFDTLFKSEFAHSKLSLEEKKNFFRVNMDLDEPQFYRTHNNPFNFIIKPMKNTMLNENLNLMYEEAFFLAFGLDCLKIFREDNKEKCLLIQDLWKIFCSLDAEFPFKYAVYHKLRSKGWVVKYGIKYGCDFLVYYEGPDRYHASFSVKIKIKDLNKLNENEADSFTQFSSLVRINETASKELLVCYAIYDSDDFNPESVQSLKKIDILEIFVNRWVAQENRDLESTNQSNETAINKMNFFESLKAFEDLDD